VIVTFIEINNKTTLELINCQLIIISYFVTVLGYSSFQLLYHKTMLFTKVVYGSFHKYDVLSVVEIDPKVFCFSGV